MPSAASEATTSVSLSSDLAKRASRSARPSGPSFETLLEGNDVPPPRYTPPARRTAETSSYRAPESSLRRAPDRADDQPPGDVSAASADSTTTSTRSDSKPADPVPEKSADPSAPTPAASAPTDGTPPAAPEPAAAEPPVNVTAALAAQMAADAPAPESEKKPADETADKDTAACDQTTDAVATLAPVPPIPPEAAQPADPVIGLVQPAPDVVAKPPGSDTEPSDAVDPNAPRQAKPALLAAGAPLEDAAALVDETAPAEAILAQASPQTAGPAKPAEAPHKPVHSEPSQSDRKAGVQPAPAALSEATPEKKPAAHAVQAAEHPAIAQRAATADAPAAGNLQNGNAPAQPTTPSPAFSVVVAPVLNQGLQLQNARGAAASDALVPVAGLAVEIATRARDGDRRFDIRLDPPELGRIDVRLDVDKNGSVTSRLIVDRPETLDLLRRDASTLERALQSSGLKTEGGLEFSLRDQSFAGRGQEQRQGARADATSLIVHDEDLPPVDAGRRGYGRLLGFGSGVDIRI